MHYDMKVATAQPTVKLGICGPYFENQESMFKKISYKVVERRHFNMKCKSLHVRII